MAHTILIVEDDREFAKLLAIMFEKQMYRALIASDVQSALQQLEAQKIDLIVLDLMLNGPSGWELIDQLQSRPGWKTIPVIITTARHQSAEYQRVDAHRYGFVYYMTKPFLIPDLIARVEEVLSASGASEGKD